MSNRKFLLAMLAIFVVCTILGWWLWDTRRESVLNGPKAGCDYKEAYVQPINWKYVGRLKDIKFCPYVGIGTCSDYFFILQEPPIADGADVPCETGPDALRWCEMCPCITSCVHNLPKWNPPFPHLCPLCDACNPPRPHPLHLHRYNGGGYLVRGRLREPDYNGMVANGGGFITPFAFLGEEVYIDDTGRWLRLAKADPFIEIRSSWCRTNKARAEMIFPFTKYTHCKPD